MNFGECYESCRGERPVFSFEVFPPRTEAAHKRFRGVLPELVSLNPDFITVTYGALGSTRDSTIEIARTLLAETRVETACHLTCVGSTRSDIDDILDQIQASGIRNIVALRGDPPQGETEFRPPEGGYAHAVELVRHIRGREGFGVAVAGYPEKHIESPDFDTDLRYLRDKVDAGADIVITQLFYDNRHFFGFVEKARALGITCPIVPGILPILSGKQVRRITDMCGARIPPELQARLDATGDDGKAAMEVGIRQAVSQVRELLEGGVPGIHFYVLNRSSHMKQIFAALGLTARR